MNTTANKIIDLFKLSTAFGTNVYYYKKNEYSIGFFNNQQSSELAELINLELKVVHISILDFDGKKYFSSNLNLVKEKRKLNFNNLPFGEYEFILSFGSKQFIRKMVIQENFSQLEAA